MTWTTPKTYTVGEVLTAATMNTHVRDNLNAVRELIYDTTVAGASVASVDITAIPATYAHLQLIVYARSAQATTLANLWARFNNDSGGNYDRQSLQGSGAAASAAEGFAQSAGKIGLVPGSSAGADLFSTTVVWIGHYAGSADNKIFVAQCAAKFGTATGNMTVDHTAGAWRSSNAIDRITILDTGGNLEIGTRVSLYGTQV